MELNTDGEGFLVNRDDWTEEVARELARGDDMDIDDEIMGYIHEARQMFDADGVVPPIRKFAKAMNTDTKHLYDVFHKGPMKLICKWGGLPKPTGCV
jgi:TusE/DsrC/DsvC family sulfur relay protein